jgi:hypothetical protein
VPGGWSHSAVRPCSADVSLPRLEVLTRHGSRRSGPKTAPKQNNNPAPVTGTVTGRAQAPSTVRKAAGCPEAQPLSPYQCRGPGQTPTAALLLLSGQTLLAHGTGRVIGGLHVQPAALRGASDVNSRTGDRRPRPRALCCTKMQLPIHPLLRLLGRRSAVPARPPPDTDHPSGLSTRSHAGDRVAAPTGGSAHPRPGSVTVCDQLKNEGIAVTEGPGSCQEPSPGGVVCAGIRHGPALSAFGRYRGIQMASRELNLQARCGDRHWAQPAGIPAQPPRGAGRSQLTVSGCAQFRGGLR